MKILYAGDSPVGGAANYLLGVMKYIKADVTHLPPSEKLLPALLKKKYNVFILSDFSRKNMPPASEKLLLEQVEKGSGLLMVGGWGSFSGPFGGWRGSRIEAALPVKCSKKDDRTNFPGGAAVFPTLKHPALKGVKFGFSPAICGMNAVTPKKNARVALGVRRILSDACCAGLEEKIRPLLVVSASGPRTAAFTTDFAPHWCGGLVDWGSRTLKLPVTPRIMIQVGDQYAALIAGILRWLARLS